jgi:hypothetical protein
MALTVFIHLALGVLVDVVTSLRHQKLVRCSEQLSREHLMRGGATWAVPMTFTFMTSVPDRVV